MEELKEYCARILGICKTPECAEDTEGKTYCTNCLEVMRNKFKYRYYKHRDWSEKQLKIHFGKDLEEL